MKKKGQRRPAKGIDRYTDRLYKAVAAYVKNRNGSLVVIGGIQVIEWPGDGVGKFTIGIKCLGKKPVYSEGTGG